MNSETVSMVERSAGDAVGTSADNLGTKLSGKDGKIHIANILLDLITRQFFVNSREVRLTTMEFDLLSYLTVNRNRAISRNELLKEIWKFENIVETRATDDLIKRLRKKLEQGGSQLKIATVWGFGFKVAIP